MDPLKMYFLFKMVIFQPAMLVYQRAVSGNAPAPPETPGRFVSKNKCFAPEREAILRSQLGSSPAFGSNPGGSFGSTWRIILRLGLLSALGPQQPHGKSMKVKKIPLNMGFKHSEWRLWVLMVVNIHALSPLRIEGSCRYKLVCDPP